MLEPSHDVILPTVSCAATEIDSSSASDIDEDHGFATGHELGSSGVEGDFTNDRELGDWGVEGDFTIEDDCMNGSCMPGLTDTQEVALARVVAPPRVVWAVTDVLAAQPLSATARFPAAFLPGRAPWR